ncbi:MAG: hypothetical protein KC613_04120 [Myxococcales bacterium]|nr:hypothetical protein [Myxococcales bacterium]
MLALLGAAVAHAEGPGVRAGDLVFHPHAWVGGGYDSNVFSESKDDRSAINDAVVLKVGGGLGLRNQNPNKVAIDIDSQVTYRHFTAINELEGAASDLISSRNAVSDAGLKGKLVIGPRSVVSLSLHEDFGYTERPPYSDRDGLTASARVNGGQITEILGYQRISNQAGVDLAFHPGPPDGRALEMRLGYRFGLVRFLEAEALGASRANQNSHDIKFKTSWKFLPKTAAELTVNYRVNDFEQPLIVEDPGANPVQSADRDNKPLTVTAGLRGLVTKRLSTLLEVGYGNSFNVVGDSYSMAVGRLELHYVIEPTLAARLGYQRRAAPSAFSNFVTVDRIYAGADLNFFRVFSLGLAGEFGYWSYSRSGSPAAVVNGERVTVQRDDPVARAQVALGYNALDWLVVRGTWTFEGNFTGYETPSSNVGESDHADYVRQQAMLEVRAQY